MNLTLHASNRRLRQIHPSSIHLHKRKKNTHTPNPHAKLFPKFNISIRRSKQKKRRDKVLEPQRWHNLIGGEVDGSLGIVGERSAAEVELIPQIAQGGVRKGRVGTSSGGVGRGVDGGGSGEAPVAAMDGEDEDASPH